MDKDEERELDAVISEEKAKVVLGDAYFTLSYVQWVEELKSFVQTQRCVDCGAAYDLEEPEEEVWGWYVEGSTDNVEELEVVQFICSNCVELDDDERELNHPQSWGMLLFRREPTGTFPFDDDDDDDDD
jgi:hypothetical protein